MYESVNLTVCDRTRTRVWVSVVFKASWDARAGWVGSGVSVHAECVDECVSVCLKALVSVRQCTQTRNYITPICTTPMYTYSLHIHMHICTTLAPYTYT